MCSAKACSCGQSHGACTTEFQYAVKIVCGEVGECRTGEQHPPVAPGLYFTAINIHNPEKCRAAHFRWKVAVAGILEPGFVSPYQRTPVLQPDQALEIDCPQILSALPAPRPAFVKGYAVIESDIELDVVAVYTGTQGANWPLNSFHTERVQPRCVPVCEDLVLPLHTGLADWQTVSPAGPVAIVIPPGTWIAPPFGSSYVSQAPSDGQNAALGVRSYQLCFDLCFGYTVPAPIPLQVSADNVADVWLNSHHLGATPSVPGYTSMTALTLQPQDFLPGRNCLRIDVSNTAGHGNNPTGFALAGILNVLRGKCPCSPLPIVRRQTDGPAIASGDDASTDLPGAPTAEPGEGGRRVKETGGDDR